MFYTGLIICWTFKNNYFNIFAFSYLLGEKKFTFNHILKQLVKKK